MKKLNCWEFKKCGREPGGIYADKLGVCPAAMERKISVMNEDMPAGRRCWLIAGTMCKGDVKGTFAQKLENCKTCDYYIRSRDIECSFPTLKYLVFGRYLRLKGIITIEDTIKARSMQLKHNRKTGDIAKAKGWLTDEQIDHILIIQEETFRRFVEIAVEEGYLTETQAENLLREQQSDYLYFGEALVNLGIISEEEMIRHLKGFNKLKFKGSFSSDDDIAETGE